MILQEPALNRHGLSAFSWLYGRLDGAKSLQDKIDALKLYFGAAPAEDSAWTAALLLGSVPGRVATPRDLRAWATQATGLPAWLVERCYVASGDLSEAMALIVGTAGLSPKDNSAEIAGWPLPEPDASLAWWLDSFLPAVSKLDGLEKQLAVASVWRALNVSERIVFTKLLSGTFRVRGGRQILERARLPKWLNCHAL